MGASFHGVSGERRGVIVPLWSFSRCTLDDLTFPGIGLPYKYNLRSESGSNGLEAKEKSPLLGSRPICFYPGTQYAVLST